MNRPARSRIASVTSNLVSEPGRVAGDSRESEPAPDAEPIHIPQLGRWAVFGVWAAAALPMAALAWLVAPSLADSLSGEGGLPMAKALSLSLGLGLAWQFVLVAVLVRREQETLRWSTTRRALWLQSPRSPRSGRIGGWLWLILIPLIAVFAAEDLIPTFSHPANRDFGAFIESTAGQSFLAANWLWFALLAIQLVFNTVLGEELLFRGFLLPRMAGAFGRSDWVANGLLFAAYHLHVPWMIPATLLDTFILSYPTKRYRSAWIGIGVHSAQTALIAILVFTLVI